METPKTFEITKLSLCDSIKSGLLKTKIDSIRLLSCLSITGCDSIRLGIFRTYQTKC